MRSEDRFGRPIKQLDKKRYDKKRDLKVIPQLADFCNLNPPETYIQTRIAKGFITTSRCRNAHARCDWPVDITRVVRIQLIRRRLRNIVMLFFPRNSTPVGLNIFLFPPVN